MGAPPTWRSGPTRGRPPHPSQKLKPLRHREDQIHDSGSQVEMSAVITTDSTCKFLICIFCNIHAKCITEGRGRNKEEAIKPGLPMMDGDGTRERRRRWGVTELEVERVVAAMEEVGGVVGGRADGAV